MSAKVGNIVEGKITAVMKFGAHVELEGGEQGFLHISKISKSYVKNINDHLNVGQKVKVKIVGTTRDGKWELSIKDLGESGTDDQNLDKDFERKLSKFLKDSSRKISDYRRRLDKKRGIKKR
ncbi:MAG: S1 RNA-binding domain-containing protein [Kosmotoga sp.]|nr:S1 RNA-binding domain-containing protein [Kosmotoga sp.]MBO8166098.1 S1 RNA-binding domain-containing protein [Kosmotoga sp.]MCD6159224.1 S1 RNA-binding domain-containing protein [Kosmotoga sp.]